MPKSITRLTPEQEARMPEWAAKWIEIGLRTGETDWERFKRAARDCYRFADIEQPKAIIHVQSPVVGAFAAPIAAYLIATRPWDKKRPPRAKSSAVRSAVGSAVDSAVGSAVDSARVPFWHYWIGGQFWPAWGFGYWGATYTSFFREVCGLDLPGDLWERGKAYEATVESACYWWPNKDFIMVCARPRSIHRDAQGRLHNESGAAIDWPDGWGVWSIHGARVPESVVRRQYVAADVLKEPNAEVRRVMMELYPGGHEAFLPDAGAKMFAQDDWGKLWRVDLPEEPLVVVDVLNSTPEPDGHFKRYLLGVPPTMKTARAAIAWTFGLAEKDYAPEVMS